MRDVIDLVKQEVFYKKLKNGLEIYLFPNDKLDDYYINYFTKYGGIDLSFYDKNNNLLNSNPGIAHFLEHKMFESEGEGPFEFFAKSGSNVNAFTDYRITAYVLSGTKEFYKNLDYVISYVNSLHLTKENVEKEKGIIEEELLMYEDMPDWQIDHIHTKMLFSKSNMRHDVGGQVSDIKKITKEELETAYETFYQPSNMKIVISGKFDVDKTFSLIEEHPKLQNREKFDIKRLKVSEPYETFEKEKDIYIKDVNSPRINYALKMHNIDINFKNKVIASLFNHILFSKSSEFYEKEEGKSFSLFQIYTAFVDSFCILEIVANPKDVDKFIQKVNDTLINFEIDAETLARAKKVEKANLLNSYETNSILARYIAYDLLDFPLVLNPGQVIDDISLQDLLDYRKKIDLNNYSLLKTNYEKKSLEK